MKFIPYDHKTARLWVEACADSLSIDKLEAASMYANLCGFRTWDLLMQTIGTGRPSPTDEQVDDETMAARKDFYLSVLVEMFTMNQFHASYLLDTISPSSSKYPRKFSFDHLSMHDAPPDSLMHLFPADIDSRAQAKRLNEGLESIFEMIAENHPEFAEVDTSNFMERMRISIPIDPRAYRNFCEKMGWEVLDGTYSEDYEVGLPSFSLRSGIGDVLVYANSLTQTPMDSDDEMAEHLRQMVLSDAMEYSDSPNIMLMSGKFLTKEYKGRHYTHGGSLFRQGEWFDFLLHRGMTKVEDVFEVAASDIDFNNPDEALHDKTDGALNLFLVEIHHLDSFEALSKHKKMKAGSPSGWYTTVLVGKDGLPLIQV